jgi:hypothetical protein
MTEYNSIEFSWNSAYYYAEKREPKVNRIDILNEKLNELAAEGWELVSLTPMPDERVSIIVFKRERGSYR